MHDQPTTTRSLAQQMIEQDLLDESVLEPDEPEAPSGYELERCLGQGGCGVVYLARDLKLDRAVAIKFLHETRAADIERFRREARFTARINGPGIVQIYELGDAGDRPYIAMQFIDGGNLADADLDTVGVVAVMRDVAIGLRQAHAEGIIHRDIKPENILLDREGRPCLTDFGIARNLTGDLGDTISTDGQIMGTPGLMPPEQARGQIEAVDARSDIYAVGATLFRKLAGCYPFESTNIVDVLHAVIHDAPPLLRSHNAAVPRPLEAIVAKCMQKAREDRYRSLDELIDDFDRFLSGARIGAESSAWFRRLVGGPQPEPLEDLRADPQWASGMEIVRELASWDANLYRVSGSLSPSFSKLDSICGRLDEIIDARPETAWARFYRGVAHLRRGRLDKARDDMERAIDRVSNLAGAYFELGRLYIALHLREQNTARRHLSQVGVRDGLASSRDLLEQAILAFGEAQRLGGEVPSWLEGCAQAVARLAESDYAGCIEMCDRILEREPDVEAVWKLRGDAQQLAGRDPVASYDRALEVRRSYFEALLGKARALLKQGGIDDAREALRRALEIHPEYVDAAALLARTYLVEVEAGGGPAAIDTGLELAEEAMAMDRASYDAVVTLAELKIAKARADESDRWFAAAIETLKGAGELGGCPNRINLLTATAGLERARHARARGRDPRPQLESVMALCRTEGAHVSDNTPWEAIRVEAERELEALQ